MVANVMKRASRPEASASGERQRLELQSMRNWYLLASLTAISTVGLVVSLTPVLSQSISSFWPWARTDLVLLVGLAGFTLLLILHLTMQQLKVTRMRNQLQSLEAAANEHQRHHAARLHALLNVSRMMGSLADLESVFVGITQTCLEIFDCQRASLMMVDPDTGLLIMKAAAGHADSEDLTDVGQSVGEGIAAFVAEHKRSIVVDDRGLNREFADLARQNANVTAAMVAPIIVRDELVGVLSICSHEQQTRYSQNDLSALEVFAENAGTCIRQAERAEWMRQTIARHHQSALRKQPV
ncbi:MAG: GAF domain-containing protein [Candidatus Krumholzibacteriia bacterium]